MGRMKYSCGALLSFVAVLASGGVTAAGAQDMSGCAAPVRACVPPPPVSQPPSASCAPAAGPTVELPTQAINPGNFTESTTATAPPQQVDTTPFVGKFGFATGMFTSPLTYVDLETGQPIPQRLPQAPNAVPEPMPEELREPGADPNPQPPDHGRIMSVGKDPARPGGYLVTYQDGTVERVAPPANNQGSAQSW